MTTGLRCRRCQRVLQPRDHKKCPGCGRFVGSDIWADFENVELPESAGVSASGIPNAAVTSARIDPEVAAKEYFECSRIIDSFDQRAVTINAWSVTGSFAGIGTAFAYGKPALFLVSALGAAVFWLLEATWKTFQRLYI